jgi:hypothetical protein
MDESRVHDQAPTGGGQRVMLLACLLEACIIGVACGVWKGQGKDQKRAVKCRLRAKDRIKGRPTRFVGKRGNGQKRACPNSEKVDDRAQQISRPHSTHT